MEKNDWKKLSTAIESALQKVAKQFDVTLRGRGFRYDETECIFKLQAVVAKVDGKKFNKDKTDFKKNAWVFNLKPSDYGKTFEAHGRTFKISGLKPGARKFGIIATEVGTNNKFKFDSFDVKKYLAA